jgi:nitrogen-specific signal transduction histidine kinase
MSNYDLGYLEEAYGKTPPEELLQILRHEILRPIITNRGHARLLKKLLEDNEGDLSEDIKLCVDKIIQSGDEAFIILDALTGHRE